LDWSLAAFTSFTYVVDALHCVNNLNTPEKRLLHGVLAA
jgi:hypothetical protein